MPSSFQELSLTTDHAVPISPVGGTATVTVQSGSTVFYSSSPNVSSSLNDGSILALASQSFTNQVWLKSAGFSTVLVEVDPPVPVAGSGYTLLPLSNGIDDTVSINGILAAGGRIRGIFGQTYKISAPLVLPPGGNVELDMTGCTIAFANTGVQCNMLQNYSTAHPVATATDCSVGLHSNVVTSPTLAAVAQIGQVLALQGAGPNGGGTFVATIPMYGYVSAVGGGTVTVSLTSPNVNGTVAHVAIGSGGTAQLYNRDSNITIIGGTWNAGTNWNTLGVRTAAGINSHIMRLRRIDGLTVRGSTIQMSGFPAGGGYCFGIAVGDCTDFLIDNTTGAGCSTTFQGDGPLARGLVRNTRGTTQDDFIGAFCVGFSGSDLEGDINDLTIEGVYPNLARSAFGGGSGIGSGGAFRVLDALTIRDVKGTQQSGGLGIHLYDYAGASYVNNLLIEDVNLVPGSAVPMISLANTAGRSCRVRSVKYPLGAVAPTAGIIQIAGYSNVLIEGLEIQTIGAGAYIGVLMTAGTQTKVSVRNVTQTDAGGTSLDVVKNTGATAARVFIDNANTVLTGNLYNNTFATTTALSVSNCVQTSGTAKVFASSTGTVTVTGSPALQSGTAVLVAGTSGSIAATSLTTTGRIRLTNVGVGGTVGVLSAAIVASTGFTINSSNAADTSTIFWEIVQY